MKNLICILIAVVLLNSALAQPVKLDPSFGIGGKVVTSVSSLNDDVGIKSVILQNDNKIIAGGSSFNIIDYSSILSIVRYKSNGLLDSTFGTNGISALDSLFFLDMKLTATGKIIIYCRNYFSRYILLRLTNGGLIDSSFGINGKMPVNYHINNTATVESGVMELTADSKIIVTNPNFAIKRFQQNGDSIDSSFGIDGTTLGIDSIFTAVRSIKIQKDGKILVAGDVNSSVYPDKFAVLRYDVNGKVDSSFGINGRIIASFAQDGSIYHVANVLTKIDLQSDNKIVVGGWLYNYTTASNPFALARFNRDGNFDSTFGSNGRTTQTVFPSKLSQLNSFIFQTDNKIIAVGSVNINNQSFFSSVRYLTSGIIDTTFGMQGYASTSFGGTNNNSVAYTISLQPDSKFIVGGSSYTNEIGNYALARYYLENTLPITLISFTATKQFEAVFLEWQTSGQDDNNYIIIEKSIDGRNFKTIGEVKNKFSSIFIQTYNLLDTVQVLHHTNFYRLKQVSKDGRFKYSSVLSVDFNDSPLGLKIYPNPVGDILIIDGLSQTVSTKLEIYDDSGKLLDRKNVLAKTYMWNFKKVHPGIYFINVITANSRNRFMIIKE